MSVQYSEDKCPHGVTNHWWADELLESGIAAMADWNGPCECCGSLFVWVPWEGEKLCRKCRG